MLAETIGEAVAEMIDDALADEVKALRLEITTLQETMNELKAVVRAENAKVIDLPNPIRRAN